MDFCAKKVTWVQKFIRLYNFLANTEANWRPENIMHEVEVKLSAMHLGGRKRVPYNCKVISKLVFCLLWAHFLILFTTFMTTFGHPENFPQFLKKQHLGLAFLQLSKTTYNENKVYDNWKINCCKCWNYPIRCPNIYSSVLEFVMFSLNKRPLRCQL